MIIYSWILEHIDILSLIMDVLSLIVATILSVVIYRLERNHEKEREKFELKVQEMAAKESAKVFLIDNDEEIEYLPLCLVASKLKLKRKHYRSIITKFLKCEEAVQKEILKQAGVGENDISLKCVNYAIDCIQKDFEKARFGRNILYDDSKYFHRAFERYYDRRISNVNPCIFEPIGMKSPTLQALRVDYKWNLLDYMLKYVDKEADAEMEPPIDMVFETCNLGYCPEEEMTFWTMRIIIDGCKALRDYNMFDEIIIETQEDMYYYTILVLYDAYCIQKAGDEK